LTAATRPASDVVVVGGGVVGCSVAWHLARAGVAVTVLERGALAGQASGAAAGMLAPYGEAESSGPFLEWGLRSLAGFESLARELRDDSGVDPEFVRSGILRVATDAAGLDELRRHAGAFEDALEWLSAEELRRAAPALTPAALGALWSEREAHVRSPLLVRAYARAAEAHGARVEEGIPVVGLLRDRARVVGVETADGPRPAGAVVLCTGSWTRTAAAWLGPAMDFPIAPVRGQIVSLDAPPGALPSILWGVRGPYLVPKLDGSVVVGATTERVGFDRRVTAGAVAGLLRDAAALVPALGVATFRGAWAGLRPESPDGLPLVGPVPTVDGLVLAAGHYRNGVLLSPITGQLVADGLQGKGWSEPAFLPERWLRPAPSADAGASGAPS
jgi:glycine oxidase